MADVGESKDGTGAGDHDQPYHFGDRLTCLSHFPFTDRQYARLLVLRGRFKDDDIVGDTRPEPLKDEVIE